jgi:hypothetical protein
MSLSQLNNHPVSVLFPYILIFCFLMCKIYAIILVPASISGVCANPELSPIVSGNGCRY